MSSLIRIVDWSQTLACEVLKPGDLAVDLTAGKGRDTLALAEAVGHAGQVVSFDTQGGALEQTRELLQGHGYTVKTWTDDREIPTGYEIVLVHACHSSLKRLLSRRAKVITANLGYLPGGDRSLVTRPESTLAALKQSLDLLSVGGRLAVTVYPAHSGGMEEAQIVDTFFTNLPYDIWQVLLLRVANRDQAPYLMAAERLR
jgi:16S rRNA C1402 N4-methylase RsmH